MEDERMSQKRHTALMPSEVKADSFGVSSGAHL
jgi:hypothetical protein